MTANPHSTTDEPPSNSQRVALVTGASRGIGKAIALGLAQDGCTVIGTATSQAGADSISEYLASYAGSGMVLNVTDKANLEHVVAEINSKYGEISILVNNAGIAKDGLFLRMQEDAWDQVIDTNLKSVFLLSKAVIRGMIKLRFGRIINLSSIVAAMGNPGQVNYCSAKAGMLGFSKALAKEVGSRNITVNCVAPGFIVTEMTDKLSDAMKAEYLKTIPLGRLGRVEDIANCVRFLASEQASYITGETIHVNGGMYMG